jgi:hypothetical protein
MNLQSDNTLIIHLEYSRSTVVGARLSWTWNNMSYLPPNPVNSPISCFRLGWPSTPRDQEKDEPTDRSLVSISSDLWSHERSQYKTTIDKVRLARSRDRGCTWPIEIKIHEVVLITSKTLPPPPCGSNDSYGSWYASILTQSTFQERYEQAYSVARLYEI